MSLLDVRHLTVEYHTSQGRYRAVEDVSFTLEAGQSLGIVGESGCGKTTSMLALLRLLPETGRIVHGEALFKGTDLLRLSPSQMRERRWKDISLIFQGAMNSFNPTRTIGSQIAEAIRLHQPTLSRSEIQTEIGRLLELVGIGADRAWQYPHQYSGGMRQRAMIAMALACNPQIVIADEPTTALDVMIQAQILDLLQELQKEIDVSFIVVTHDLGIVAEICDHVMVMYGGWQVEYGTAEVIFNQPSHPYTQRLLAAFPDIENPRAELASIPGHPPPLDDLPQGCRFRPRCHLAMERCAREAPLAVEVSPGHFARCFFPIESGVLRE